MKINVQDIAPEGFHRRIEEDGSKIAALAGMVDFAFLEPVRAVLHITETDGTLNVTGELRTAVRLSCSRCLKDVVHRIERDFSIFFTKEAGPEEEERELTGEEIEMVHLQGDEIDTDEVLLEQIVLDIPVRPLCTPGCKGLCPKCGKDLNLGRCNCPEEKKVDPRFAKLKDFKVK